MRKTTYLIAALIGIFVFLSLIVYAPWWWFNGSDDFHGLYIGFKTKSWGQMFHFFSDGHIAQDMGPTNRPPEQATTFLTTYYRPLYCVFLTLQYWLFGTHASWYFLCNVFFHALNSALLFVVLLTMTSLETTTINSMITASCGALFFAFHPQIAYRFGAIVNLHYYINVSLMLCIYLLLKKYQTKKRAWTLYAALLLFAASLFTRESSIVLPAVALMLGANIISWVGLGCIATSFLALRLYLYPYVWASHATHVNLIQCLQTKIPQLLMIAYDIFGMSWLPWGNKLLRASLLSVLAILLIIGFAHSTKKWLTLTCFIAGFIMLWPGVIGAYSPRYMYEALPLFIMAFFVCTQSYNGFLQGYKNHFQTMALVFLIFCYAFLHINFNQRTKKMLSINHALTTLVKHPQISTRPLCFLSYPMDGFGDQPASIVRVLRNSTVTPIFCDTATALVHIDSNIVQPAWWGMVCSTYFDDNYIRITRSDNAMRYVSHNPDKINFFLSDNQSYSLGKKTVNAYDQGRIIDFTLHIDKQYVDTKPLFAVWNYETKLFDLIDLKDSASCDVLLEASK